MHVWPPELAAQTIVFEAVLAPPTGATCRIDTAAVPADSDHWSAAMGFELVASDNCRDTLDPARIAADERERL